MPVFFPNILTLTDLVLNKLFNFFTLVSPRIWVCVFLQIQTVEVIILFV